MNEITGGTIVMHFQKEETHWSGYCPALGLMISGDTFKETQKELADLIDFRISDTQSPWFQKRFEIAAE